MSTGYSAHPVLASEQLKNAEKTKNAKNQTTTSTTSTTTAVNSKSQRHSPQHRHRQHKTNSSIDEGGTTTTTSTTIRGFFNFSPFKSKTKIAELATTAASKADDNKVVDENMPPTPMRATTPQKTLPVRTTSRQQQHRSFPDDTNYEPDDDDDEDEYDAHVNDDEDDDTKDCVDSAAPPLSKTENQHEPIIRHDQLQHRLSRTNRQTNFGFDDLIGGGATSTKTFQQTAVPQTPIAAPKATTKSIPAFSDGCPSGFSSTISSPSPSTVSSPLSTPTRLTTQLQLQHSHHHHQLHQHCCRKSSPGALSTLHPNHHHLHHHHHHHHHHLASSAAAAAAGSDSSSLSAASGCKKLQKFDPRFGPSPYRQLLPILLCILSFATVFTILIIYMDTTEIRHQQFRLNMSRDYDLYGVAQDDPDLVTFLREIHMRKYSTYFLKNRIDPTSASTASAASSSLPSIVNGGLNFSAQHIDGLVPEMAHYVAELLGGKMNGVVLQSLTGAVGHLTTAPWLSETLNWAGIIVEPEPRRYFTLRKQHMQRAHMQVVHACVSPNPYPKEVTIHNEESEVRINSLLDAESSWFNSRVKCFPLYTIMLACNRVEYDLLSLGVHGHELEILQTLPYDKIKIEVISIHLQDNLDKTPRGYIQKITKFLTGKSYKLQKKFGSNYFYQRINTTNRTRKKDILLLKTP